MLFQKLKLDFLCLEAILGGKIFFTENDKVTPPNAFPGVFGVADSEFRVGGAIFPKGHFVRLVSDFW